MNTGAVLGAEECQLAASRGMCEQSVEITLEPDVLNLLSRRGRRKLRDIQSSSQTVLKLDRLHGVLAVRGSQASIAEVRRQLGHLSSDTLQVTAAVWAELMRTRKNSDSSLAAVARIQEQSGCRMHVERDSQKVQLFGPKEETAVGQYLLRELETICIEDTVESKYCPRLDSEELHAFAQEFGVTLEIQDTQISVLGIEGAVMEAVRELRGYSARQRDLGERRLSSNVARTAIEGAMSKLEAIGSSACAAATAHSENSANASEVELQGMVLAELPRPCLQGPPRQDKEAEGRRIRETRPQKRQVLRKRPPLRRPDQGSVRSAVAPSHWP